MDNPQPQRTGDGPSRSRWLHRTPFHDRRTEASAGKFGLALLLGSLATVFGATIVAVVAIRLLDAAPDRWRPAEASGLPWELLLSTLLLLLGSATIEAARFGIRRGDDGATVRWLRATAALGGLFMLSQVWCWIRMLQGGMPPTTSLFGWIFTVLTVLHAAHVIAGLAAIGLITLRAEAGRYTADDCAGIDAAALYWHFLDLMWVLLLITLWLIV